MPKVREDIDERLTRMDALTRLSSEACSSRQSAVRTVVQSVVMWAGNMLIGDIADALKLNHGGYAGAGELYAKKARSAPLKTYVSENFAIPVIEEMIFRLLPSALFAEERGQQVRLHWEVGLPSTLIFGMVHNFSKPEADKITLHWKSLPLEQLILGAYCWYAQRKGGFVHAAGAHVLYNNLCVLYEKYRYAEPPVGPQGEDPVSKG